MSNPFVGNRPACSVYNDTVGSIATNGRGAPLPYEITINLII